MLVKKRDVNALLSMLCRLRFSNSFQSDNIVYCDLNNRTLDFLSSFMEIVLNSEIVLVVIVQLLYDFVHQVDY